VLIALNKPFGVLCQFTTDDGRPTLANYVRQKDVYPAGRLDHDSEGLLLLTDDGALAHRLTDPRHKQPKTYLVQVDGAIHDEAIGKLCRGVVLNDGPTLPAQAEHAEATRSTGTVSPKHSYQLAVDYFA
jgi:23S rRNA pseudouridine2457 synthase